MRLIDYDKLIKELKDSGIPFNADINEIITTQPIVDMDKQIATIKQELNDILTNYERHRVWPTKSKKF